MKKYLTLFFGSPMLLSSLFPLACSNDYNKLHDNFVYQKNFANPSKNFSYAYSNSNDDVLKEINLATGAKLFRIGSQNQPKIDFRDNITTKPTELWYQFEHCSSITIKNSKHPEGITYSKDTIMKTIYKETLDSEKKPNFFYPKKDKGNGFYKPYLFVPSNNKESINHESFFENLKSATSVSLNFNENNYVNYWVDTKGKETPYKITGNDFRLGLLRSFLKNKIYRDNFISKKNINSEKEKKEYIKNKDNPYFNGEDIQKFFDLYNIQTEGLFNFNKENDSITFNSKDNKENDFTEFFRNLFLYSNIMDGMPYQYLAKKYNLDKIDWFYEYGKTHDSMLYCSYYYVAKNTSNETRLFRNTNYIKNNSEWQNTKHLNEVVYKYNSIPISKEAYALQMYNAFKQNIVSSLDVSDLNSDQKQYILSNYDKFNLNFIRKFEKYKSHNNIIHNYFPSSNSYYFNNNFSKLYYGNPTSILSYEYNQKAKDYYSKKSLIFKTLLNNVINPQAITNLLNSENETWMSQAPSDLNINSKNKKNTNYEILKDAQSNLSNQTILGIDENEFLYKFNNSSQYDNKLKFNSNFINLYESLKSYDFEEIKFRIKKIIDEFYSKNENSDDFIEWDIPIEAFNLSEDVKNKLRLIEKIYSELHSKLKPRLVFVNNYETYEQYFLKNKSIYKENKFTLFESNTTRFIIKMIQTDNYRYLSYIINMLKNVKNDNAFSYLSRMINSLDSDVKKELLDLQFNSVLSNDIKNKVNKVFVEYLKNQNTQDVVNIIREINNIFSYTISTKNNVSLYSFNKIAYQKFITKPISYDGLSYLQDIYLD